jgi:hypothetical protein
MFITHCNGLPALFKTNRGNHPIAFESLQDGNAFLQSRKAGCALSTFEEILKINPKAFPQTFHVVYLTTRKAIEMFAYNAKGFPTEEFLVTLKHDVVPPEPDPPETPRADPNQGKLGF